MTSSIRSISKEIKENIYRDYLSGMSTKEIRVKYKFKDRSTVYFHLYPLTKEDKIMHMKSKVKRMIEEMRGDRHE